MTEGKYELLCNIECELKKHCGRDWTVVIDDYCGETYVVIKPAPYARIGLDAKLSAGVASTTALMDNIKREVTVAMQQLAQRLGQ